MRQTQIVFFLLLAVKLLEANQMEKLLQLHRVMQLEPQIKRAMKAVIKEKRQVEPQPGLYRYQNDLQTENEEEKQSIYRKPSQNIIYEHEYKKEPQEQQYYNQGYDEKNVYLLQRPGRLYYTVLQNENGEYEKEPYYQQDNGHQFAIPVLIPYPFPESNLQQVQYEPQHTRNKQTEAILHKFQEPKYQNEEETYKEENLPLHYLINDLVEPMKLMIKGKSKFGKQPVMPVYHYVPVPKGTFQDTKLRGDQDGRIKGSSPPLPEAEAPAKVVQKEESPEDSGQPTDGEDYSVYDFGYRVTDSEKGVEMGKTETKVNGVTKGSYHVLLPDGRLQIVKYWSDHTGYHTDISYQSKS